MSTRASTILMTATAGTLAAGAAQAAGGDAAQRWTGLYLGAQISAAEGVSDNNRTESFTVDGYGVGARAGYNFGYDGFLFGAEAQASFLNHSGRSDLFFAGKNNNLDPVNAAIGAEFSAEGSLRAKMGLPIVDGVLFDNILFYGTGGVSWMRVENTYTDTDGAVLSRSKTHQGIVAGGGVEAAINDRFSILLEVTTTQYDSESYGFPYGVDVFDQEVVTGAVGLNWKLSE